MHEASEAVSSPVEPGVSPWSRVCLLYACCPLLAYVYGRVSGTPNAFLFLPHLCGVQCIHEHLFKILRLSPQVYTCSLFGDLNSLSLWLLDLCLGVLIVTLPHLTPLMLHSLTVLLLSHGSAALLCESVLNSELGTVEGLATQRHLSNKKWWQRERLCI